MEKSTRVSSGINPLAKPFISSNTSQVYRHPNAVGFQRQPSLNTNDPLVATPESLRFIENSISADHLRASMENHGRSSLNKNNPLVATEQVATSDGVYQRLTQNETAAASPNSVQIACEILPNLDLWATCAVMAQAIPAIRSTYTHVLNMSQTRPLPGQQVPRGSSQTMQVVPDQRFDIIPHLDDIIQFIDDGRRGDNRILICGNQEPIRYDRKNNLGNVDRSAVAAIAYLCYNNGQKDISSDDAKLILDGLLPNTKPNPNFLVQIDSYNGFLPERKEQVEWWDRYMALKERTAGGLPNQAATSETPQKNKNKALSCPPRNAPTGPRALLNSHHEHGLVQNQRFGSNFHAPSVTHYITAQQHHHATNSFRRNSEEPSLQYEQTANSSRRTSEEPLLQYEQTANLSRRTSEGSPHCFTDFTTSAETSFHTSPTLADPDSDHSSEDMDQDSQDEIRSPLNSPATTKDVCKQCNMPIQDKYIYSLLHRMANFCCCRSNTRRFKPPYPEPELDSESSMTSRPRLFSEHSVPELLPLALLNNHYGAIGSERVQFLALQELGCHTGRM